MIPNSEDDLEQYRRLRQGAWASFDGNLDVLRDDLSGTSIWERIKRRAAREGQSVIEEGLELANDHKAALAIGSLAVAAWIFRHPLMALGAAGLERLTGDTRDQPEQ